MDKIIGLLTIGFMALFLTYMFSDGSVDAIENAPLPRELYKFASPSDLDKNLYKALDKNEKVDDINFKKLSFGDYLVNPTGVNTDLILQIRGVIGSKKDIDMLDEYFDVVTLSFNFQDGLEKSNVTISFVVLKGKLFYFTGEADGLSRPWAIPLGMSHAVITKLQ